METCHIVYFVFILFTVASVSGRSARQAHECPAYECEPGVNASGCEPGYICAIMNCGNLCVPDYYYNLQTLGKRAAAALKRQQDVDQCPIDCLASWTCPFGYRNTLDGCQWCGCNI